MREGGVCEGVRGRSVCVKRKVCARGTGEI